MTYNIFIYFGAILNKNDYENLQLIGIDDLYTKIYSNGLQFKEIGDATSSWEYVVGKELKWEQGLITNIEDFKLSIEDENEIRKKLLDIGIHNQPEYKIFISWI